MLRQSPVPGGLASGALHGPPCSLSLRVPGRGWWPEEAQPWGVSAAVAPMANTARSVSV